MAQNTLINGKPIASFLAPFDRLANNLTTMNPITPADLVPFTSLQWPDHEFFEIALKNSNRETACSVLQLMMRLFISAPDWLIGCVVPGIPILNHPSAAMINLIGPKQEYLLPVQWVVFPYKKDGIRTNMQVKACLTAKDPSFWRASVLHWATIWNSLSINHVEREERLKAIYYVTNSLGEGNPDPLRSLVKETEINDELDLLAGIMFGTCWDLLVLINRIPKNSVSSGAWQFPDFSAHEIRCRALIYQNAAQLYFQPAMLDIELMHLNVMHWALPCTDIDLKNAINRTMETLKHAYYQWNLKSASYIVNQLFKREIADGEYTEKFLGSALANNKDIFLYPLTITEAKNWLIEHGHYDWCQRLAKVCIEKSPSKTVRVKDNYQSEENPTLQFEPGKNDPNQKNNKRQDNRLIVGWIISLFIIAITVLIWINSSTKHELRYLQEKLNSSDIPKIHNAQLLDFGSIDKLVQEVRYLVIMELLRDDIRLNWLDIAIQQGNKGETLLKGEVPTIYLKTLIVQLIGKFKEIYKINIEEIKVTSFYNVQPGDNLWKIAEKVYGDSKHWRKIYEANRKKITGSFEIQKNITLSIPD